jgi:CubicO group peptidase (beta-lactamase class C family)
MPTNFTPGDRSDPYRDYTVEQLYEFLAGATLHSEPGKQYEYSNVGSAVLGHALTLHGKQKYRSLLAERIFKPLKMEDSATMLSDEQLQRAAEPFADGRRASAWNLNLFNPAGGIRSNIVDMMRYVEAQLGQRRSSLDKAIELSHQHRRDIPTGGIGLGWHIARDKTTRWHNGQTGGFHTYVGFNRELDVGVVLLASSDSYQLSGLGEQLVRMLAGGQEKPAEFEKGVKVDRKTLEKYVGVYAVAPTFLLTVTLEDDRLQVQATGQDKFAVYPESATRFKYRVVEAAIVFEVDKDGRTNKLTIHQDGREIPAVRVKR